MENFPIKAQTVINQPSSGGINITKSREIPVNAMLIAYGILRPKRSSVAWVTRMATSSTIIDRPKFKYGSPISSEVLKLIP